MLIRYGFLWLLLLWCAVAEAQLPTFDFFDRLSTREGLSSDAHCRAYRDSHGYVWITSQDGLNRYDGFSIRRYYHKDSDSFSIPDNWVIDVHEDYGKLWISSLGGICIYDYKHDRFIPYRFASINAKGKNTLKYDRTWKGNWLFFVGGDLLLKDSLSGKETFYDLPSNPTHEYFSVYPFGNKLVVGHRGLYFIDWTTQKLDTSMQLGTGVLGRCGNISPLAFHEDDLYLWISTWGNGILQIDKRTAQTHSHIFEHVEKRPGHTNICFNILDKKTPEGKRYFLLGTESGLQAFYPETGQFNILVPNRILNGNKKTAALNPWFIYEDKQGILWIEDADYGIAIYRQVRNHFRVIDVPALSGPHLSFKATPDLRDSTGNTLYFAASTKGVVRYNIREGSTHQFLKHKEPSEDVLDIFSRRNGDWWIRYAKSWVACDFKTGKRSQLFYRNKPLILKAITEDNAGNLWMRNDSACLVKLDLNNKLTVYPIPDAENKRFWGDIIWDGKRHRIWFSFLTGISYFDTERSLFAPKAITDRLPLLRDAVLFPVDHHSNIVFRDRRGLFFFNPDKTTLRLLSISDLLASNLVSYCIQDRQDYYWVNTGKGVSRIDPTLSSSQNYTLRHPDLSNYLDYKTVVLPGGRMLIPLSGDGKLVLWQPIDFNYAESQPKLFITEIAINDTPFHNFTIDDSFAHFSLSYKENYIRIGVGMNEYMFPESHEIRYRINKGSWQPLTNQKIAFVLRPGNYIIELSGNSYNTGWSKNPLSIFIEIKPPFWQRWWFITGLIISALILVSLFFRYRLQQILKLLQVRNKIAKDLHDDVGSTMSTISILSEVAKNNLHKQEIALGILNNIGTNSRQLLETLDDIVWSVNPKNDSFAQMLLRMKQFALELLGNKGIKLHFELTEQVERLALSMERRRNIYLIYKEALHNIAKYADAREVSIKIFPEGKRILMEVKDDGKGFDPDNVKKGNGLQNMTARARSLGGHCILQAAPGKGTLVSLDIPWK